MKIGYARVSTTDQNLDLQLRALEIADCDKIYKDHGLSGACRQRDGLDLLLNDIQKGDVLVVWKLDRLARSLKYLCELLDKLAARCVGFNSLTDGIDTTTASGKLVFHMMGALAEFERALISECTIAGMRAARLRGVHIGRPRSLTDHDISKLTILSDDGWTQQQMANQFNVSINTIARALKRRGT